MGQTKNIFHYTYSAKQQEEIRSIRNKYLSKEDKMEQLRRLDQKASKRAALVSGLVGIAGFLILGLGIYCGIVWMILPGIIIAIIGIVNIIAAYAVYSHIVKKVQKRLAPKILKLTDELSKTK